MKEKRKERKYTVTEEEYREELAQGFTDDEVLKPGTYKVTPSRFRANADATDPANCKVKITTYLDADVLEFFKRRAAQPNAAPYQTQINNELRKVMEGASSGTASIEKELLNDEKFLKKLKKKLEAV